MPDGPTCWVYYSNGKQWRWECVGTYATHAAALGWLRYYLQRKRRKAAYQGIDGVILPFGVQPVRKIATR